MVWCPADASLGGETSNIFYFHHYLGKVSNLTNIFQMDWKHQPVQKFGKNIFVMLIYWL